MYEDGDPEASEFDIESRSWKKLEKNLKSIGYREGAVRGKDLSLQEGFNLGYADGFKLGEYLGMTKGIISCQSELGLRINEKCEFDEKTLSTLSDESCILCVRDKVVGSTQSQETISDNFEDFLSTQQSLIDKSVKTLQQSDLKLYFENG